MHYNEYLQLMLDAALDIKAGNFDKRCGICGNIARKVTDAMNADDEIILSSWQILKRASIAWPKFSGDVDYPIKDPTEIETAYNVYTKLPKWIGDYGALRFELLDHIIDFLKKEIESATRTA